jgi:hypothetical protein
LADKHGLLDRLLKLQEDLRTALMEELAGEDEELGEIFSPDSFSNKYEVYRYKYTERLDTLNRIIAEIQRSDGGRPTFKVFSVEATGREELMHLVNKRLAKARPSAVADLKIFHDRSDNRWVAIIVCGY